MLNESTICPKKHLPFAAIFIITCFANTLPAQTSFPSTLRIPVTFCDFHADSSNPEFEIHPSEDAVKTGMVASTLDGDKKPTLGPNPFFNRMIARWFRPWTPGSPLIYNYYGEPGEMDGTRFNRYQSLPRGLTNAPHDTSFKNIVIQDTLEFRYVNGSNGMYEFSSDNFFPLDNRGFGAEGRSHNYAFTMELHWTFTKVPGLTFNFTGDDDVWAFVNNSLVMDIGGIHNPSYGQFNVDNLSGLTARQNYSFDLFYAERHVTGSNIRITTNIIAPSSMLQLYDNPNPPGNGNRPVTFLDNIKPGTPVTVYGHVFDTTGVWQSEYDKEITWRIEATGAVNLSSTKGAATTLTADASLAGSQFVLVATFKNPNDNASPSPEARITIRIASSTPPPPDTPDTLVEDHLDIVLDSAAAYKKEVQMRSFGFSSDMKQKTVYAVIRDRNGRFIRFANKAQWQSLNTRNITVSPSTGHVTALLKSDAATGSQTMIVASEQGLAPDTLLVIILAHEQSAVIPNPFVPGKTDITAVLPQSFVNNYAAAIKAAKTNYVTLAVIEAPESLVVINKNNTEPRYDSYADVQVYDAVGNLVRTDLDLIAGERNLTFAVAWNGTNKNNRIVGFGAYLMVIKAKKKSGQPYIIEHKIGIATRWTNAK